MLYIPYIVAALAVVTVFCLKRGHDLAVAVALIPWWALEVEFGLSVKISEMIMAVLIFRHALAGEFHLSSLPGGNWLLAYLALSLVMAAVTIEFGPDVPQFAGGGPMRNGYGRVVTSISKILILFSFLVLILSHRYTRSPFRLMKAYVYSCMCLAILGVVQMVVHLGSGVDIFPIGMFAGSEYEKSGSVLIQGQHVLRVCSLGGEPKGFGQALAVALCILIIFADRFGMSRFRYRLAAGLLFGVTLLTSSTSAYVTLMVAFAFIFVFSRKPTPFRRLGIMSSLSTIMVGLVSVYLGVAYFTDALAAPVYPKLNSFAEAIVYKATSRVSLDDTDAVVMESFVAEPEGIVFGRGMGLVHHYAYRFVPRRMQHYLAGQIVVPKSGIAKYLGDAGVLGLLCLILAVSNMMPANLPYLRNRKRERELVTGLQSLSFGLFAALLLRLYSFEIIWVVMACVAVVKFQLGERAKAEAAAQKVSLQRKRAIDRQGARSAA